MIEIIDGLDKSLFLWIQHHCRFATLDAIMPWIRHKETWFPLYCVLIILITWKLKWLGARIFLVIILVVVINDSIGSGLVKHVFKRTRPCKNTEVLKYFTPLIDCSSGYSFASNHASNHFAIAVTLGLFFIKKRKWILITGILWAALISFAQVYVGVHYPLDILGGAILGSSIAILLHLALAKYFNSLFVWS